MLRIFSTCKEIHERKCIKGKDLVWDSMICFVGDYAIGSNVINILHNEQIKVIYWQLCIQLHELPTKLNIKFPYWMIGQWFFFVNLSKWFYISLTCIRLKCHAVWTVGALGHLDAF